MIDIKKQLRNRIAEIKSKHSVEQLETMSESVVQNLQSLELFQKSEIILLYYSMPDEVNTKSLIASIGDTKQIVLPVVTNEGLVLKRYLSEDSLLLSKYGIKEPIGEEFIDFNKIDLVIVPGVAFDSSLNRIGRGMGYYDGLLPKVDATKIAICFDFQLVDEVPTENRDYKMDILVCESEIIQ